MCVLEPAKKYSVNYATRRIESHLSSNLFPNLCVNDIKMIMISNRQDVQIHENKIRWPLFRHHKSTFSNEITLTKKKKWKLAQNCGLYVAFTLFGIDFSGSEILLFLSSSFFQSKKLWLTYLPLK